MHIYLLVTESTSSVLSGFIGLNRPSSHPVWFFRCRVGGAPPCILGRSFQGSIRQEEGPSEELGSSRIDVVFLIDDVNCVFMWL